MVRVFDVSLILLGHRFNDPTFPSVETLKDTFEALNQSSVPPKEVSKLLEAVLPQVLHASGVIKSVHVERLESILAEISNPSSDSSIKIEMDITGKASNFTTDFVVDESGPQDYPHMSDPFMFLDGDDHTAAKTLQESSSYTSSGKVSIKHVMEGEYMVPNEPYFSSNGLDSIEAEKDFKLPDSASLTERLHSLLDNRLFSRFSALVGRMSEEERQEIIGWRLWPKFANLYEKYLLDPKTYQSLSPLRDIDAIGPELIYYWKSDEK